MTAFAPATVTVAAQAMTCRGLAAGVAGWFGREAVLDLLDWGDFEKAVGAAHAAVTRDHIERGIAASVDRARSVLGYAPRFSSLEAMYESVRWQVDSGQLDLGGQDF